MSTKSIRLIGAMLGIAFAGTVQNASAAVIAQYSFTAGTAAVTTKDANVTAGDVTASNLSYFNANYPTGLGGELSLHRHETWPARWDCGD